MKKSSYLYFILFISAFVYAGGNPEYVSYPAEYKTEFSHYDTRNRVGAPQVADLYANKVALSSVASGKLEAGSKIIMEIYKAKLGEDGTPITQESGDYIKDKLAAVAVMEKRTDWQAEFDRKERAGDWGFAIYNPDGSPKENNLPCASCHIPMPDKDYLFSYESLVQFAK